MKCSSDSSNFFEEICSLPHSIVFLYFFALFIEDGLLISPCCSLELCIQLGICFPFYLGICFLFYLLLFLIPQLFVKPPQTTTLPCCIYFFFGMVLITTFCMILLTSVHSSSGSLSTRFNPLNLFVTYTV